MSDNKNCKDCAYVIFNEQWGEFKCKKFEQTMYVLLDSDECACFKDKQKSTKE